MDTSNECHWKCLHLVPGIKIFLAGRVPCCNNSYTTDKSSHRTELTGLTNTHTFWQESHSRKIFRWRSLILNFRKVHDILGEFLRRHVNEDDLFGNNLLYPPNSQESPSVLWSLDENYGCVSLLSSSFPNCPAHLNRIGRPISAAIKKYNLRLWTCFW